MASFKYTILKYDPELLQVHLSFDNTGRFMVAQMQAPLPVTIEQFEAWVRNFLPRYEVVSARAEPHQATDDLVNSLVGKERAIEVAPPAPTEPAPTPDSAELKAAQEAYLTGIIEKVLAAKGITQ